MGKNGGARPGSGMKKGQKTKKTLDAEAALAILRQKIYENWEELAEAQINLALGIKVVGKDNKTYKKAPDNTALAAVFDRSVGKTKESLDIKHSGLTDLTQAVSELLKKK